MIALDLSKPNQRPGKGQNADFAYRVLKHEIVTLKLAPGSDFDEAETAKRLQISRTPLREATVRLAGEGLLHLHPNRGARVTPIEWDDIREHLEALEFSQRLTHRWSAIRRSDEDLKAIIRNQEAFETALDAGDSAQMAQINWDFHASIANGAKNARLEKFYLLQLTENFRISQMAMLMDYYSDESSYAAHTKNICAEHNEIVTAIENRDGDAADHWAKMHCDLARKRVAEVLLSSIGQEMNIDISTLAQK